MRRLTVSELLTATGGTLLAGGVSAAVTSVSTDSRKAGEGALFIPLTGERFDGHDYIDKALALGAAGCLCARTPAAFLPDKFYIAVPDTRLALKALASWYRGQFNIPVVQITGSVGKTTTKEMIASVVSQRYRTLKTAENFNNDIGTPLTLLGLDDTYESAVMCPASVVPAENVTLARSRSSPGSFSVSQTVSTPASPRTLMCAQASHAVSFRYCSSSLASVTMCQPYQSPAQ